MAIVYFLLKLILIFGGLLIAACIVASRFTMTQAECEYELTGTWPYELEEENPHSEPGTRGM